MPELKAIPVGHVGVIGGNIVARTGKNRWRVGTQNKTLDLKSRTLTFDEARDELLMDWHIKTRPAPIAE